MFAWESEKRSSYDIPNEPKLNRLTDFLKVLGDPTRVKILFRLFQSENCGRTKNRN